MVFLLFKFPNFVPFVFGSKKFIRFNFSGGIAKIGLFEIRFCDPFLKRYFWN